MADVKWIKITTDMFDNRKIKHLRKLPDGNNCVLIWVMLLTMAGRCNAGGMIFLTESFPYSTKMLADELDFEENTVKLALNMFEMLGMIEMQGDFITITGWNEYQNAERMAEIREYNRLAQQRSRARRKELITVKSDVNDMSMTCQHCQDTDIDIDIEEDKEIDNKRKRFIPPTVEAVQEYCRERKNNVDAEQFIAFYEAKGWLIGKNKMKDWKACVRTWEKRQAEHVKKNSFHNFDERNENYDDVFRALANKD